MQATRSSFFKLKGAAEVDTGPVGGISLGFAAGRLQATEKSPATRGVTRRDPVVVPDLPSSDEDPARGPLWHIQVAGRRGGRTQGL
jgi:hypothetical protein